MPNDSYQTMTPGSAVADKLQEILARRKQEAHDALMQQLLQENYQRNWKHQENQDTRAAEDNIRQGKVSEAQIAAHNAALERDTMEATPGGVDVSTLDPARATLLKKLGGVVQTPEQILDLNNQGQGPEDLPENIQVTPSKEVTLGGKDYQKASLERTLQEQAIQDMWDSGASPEVLNQLRFNQHGGSGNIMPKKAVTIDSSGKTKSTIEGDAGTSFIELNPPVQREPRLPSIVGTGKSAAGRNQIVRQMPDGKLVYEDAPEGFSFTAGSQVTPRGTGKGSKIPTYYDVDVAKEYSNLRNSILQGKVRNKKQASVELDKVATKMIYSAPYLEGLDRIVVNNALKDFTNNPNLTFKDLMAEVEEALIQANPGAEGNPDKEEAVNRKLEAADALLSFMLNSGIR